jgi:hypothetical protein
MEIRNDVLVIILGLLAYFGLTTLLSCLLRLCLNPRAVGIKTYEMVVKSILEPDMLLIDSLKHRRELRRVLRENAKVAGKTHRKHILLVIIVFCSAVLLLSQAFIFWLVRPSYSETILSNSGFPRLTYRTGVPIGENDGNCIRRDKSKHTESETTVFSESVCLHTLRYSSVIGTNTTTALISYKVPSNTEPLVTVEVGNASGTALHYDYVVVKNVAAVSRGVTAVFLHYGDATIKDVMQALENRNRGCARPKNENDALYRNYTFTCSNSSNLASLLTELPKEQLAQLRYGTLNEPEFTSEVDNATQSFIPGSSTDRDVVSLKKSIPVGSAKGVLLLTFACISALTLTAILIRQDMGATAAFFSRIHEDNSECGRDPLEIDNLPIYPSYSEHGDGLWHRHVGVSSESPRPGVVSGVLAGNPAHVGKTISKMREERV